MKLSIIIPAHDEEENIAEVIGKIERELKLAIDYELLVVNDHSSDSTPQIVSGLTQQYANLRLVHNLQSAGFANALRCGFANAHGELVVPMMADLCDDLNSLAGMLEKIRQGYDIVCASRYIRGGSRIGGSKLKGFLSCLAGWSVHGLLGIPTHDVANAFKMYRKSALEGIEIKSRSFEISMEIALKAYYAGFKISEVPSQWKERSKGQSKFRVLKLLPGYMRLYLWAIYQRIGGIKCRCFR